MRSFFMIVSHERADGGSEVFLAEWYDAVQTLGSDRPDKSLGKGVQIGTSRGKSKGFTPPARSTSRKAAV